MESTIDQIKNKLVEKKLRVTPQRISVLQAIYTLNNHPTAEMILDRIKEFHPNIATGTVYNVLDILVDHNLIKRVKTDKDIMRYDGMMEKHHHLYCSECEQIEDYMDDELDRLLSEYFKKKRINNFEIEEIKLHINGKFLKQEYHERKKH